MKKTTISCLLLALTACNPNYQSPQTDRSQSGNNEENALFNRAETPVIQVTNLKGEAIEGAQILFGSRVGQPFVHNLLQTDRTGKVAIPEEWNSPVSVTVDHPGHMRITYLNVSPRELTFKLRPIEKSERIEMSGATTGFGPLEKNNIADFGLVIPSLTKRDLFSFSMDKIISPEMDAIEIAGFESKVPSNLTFPKQRESYVIPVTFEKERYRMYFAEKGPKKVYALHGKFPFKEVIDKIRTKVPFATLINHFEFVSGSIKEIQLNGPTSVNLPVNEMTFAHEETIVPPHLDSDKVMLAISLFENNGYLYPTDMHKVDSPDAFNLKGLENSQRLFLSMLLRADDFYARGETPQEAISAELAVQSPNHSPLFMDIITPPTPTASGWTIKTPTINGTINPLTTYSVLSRVYRNGKQKTIIRDWEVYSENWVDSIELPEWPASKSNKKGGHSSIDPMAMADGHRWEVTFIGTNQKLPIPANVQLGPDIVDYTSHISFNSIEF